MSRPMLGALFVLACLAGCGDSAGPAPGASDEGRLRVAAVNYPLAYFAGRIGGPHVAVSFPVPRGEDPAFWRPSTADLAHFEGADLVLLNGADYAKWRARAALPPDRLVDTSASFRDRYIEVESTAHDHGPAGTHEHGALAFTTWLDLSLAAAQARAVGDALGARLPEHAEGVRARSGALQADLMSLHAELAAVGAAHGEVRLLASHPVYAYLARAYGFDIESLLWEPTVVPPEAEWTRLAGALETRPCRWLLWAAKPRGASITKLEMLGVLSFVFDPCANRPSRGDFLDVMRKNVRRLRTALGG